jgi:hypothetical protein
MRLRSPAREARRRGPRVANVAALSVVLLTAGVVAAVLSSRAPSLTGSHEPEPAGRASVTANAAAGWIAGQVSHDAYVACDRVMCDALTAHQFPGRKLQLIRPNSRYPLHAQVVVVTPIVQREFGDSLATDWAPAVLATFGSGSNAIAVRIVAPDGAAKYEAQLKTDVRQRGSGGAGLLGSPEVTASPAARKLLLAGRVDTRLILVLTALAALKPIDILGFGTPYPGTSMGIPLRTANLAQDDAQAGMSRSDYLKFLIREVDQQTGVYRPLSSGPGRDAAGKPILRITFAAPSPLLLFGGQAP